MGRGRGIADFVSSLTDQQAVAFADRLGGARGAALDHRRVSEPDRT